MTADEPATLGQRLDRLARSVSARHTEAARRVAQRERSTRRWEALGNRRLRVEADVPPAWVDVDERSGPVEIGTTATAGGLPFPTDLREQLRPILGPQLSRVVLHDGDTDPSADAIARAHDAAAVTVGQEIFLRQGRFRPWSPQGRGLLAHEAVHAARAVAPDAAWTRATAHGRAREEQAAHALARRVAAAPAAPGRSLEPGPPGDRNMTDSMRDPMTGSAGPEPGSGTPPSRSPGPGVVAPRPARVPAPRPPSGPGSSTATTAVMTPMAAPAEATIETPPPPRPAPTASPGLTHEAVLRQLTRQVRIDRERGA